MLKISPSRDRLIFNMGMPMPGKVGLYIETGPCILTPQVPLVPHIWGSRAWLLLGVWIPWPMSGNQQTGADYTHNRNVLTHWGRVTHICVSKLTITGSDNGLSPGRRQAIIWTNAGILSNRTLGTNFSETLSEIHAFSFKKMHLKMSSAK